MDLEVTGTDRDLHPVTVAPRLCEGACDERLADAVEAEHATARPRRAREELDEWSGFDGARPEVLQLARRAGQDDDDTRARVEHDSGRGPRDAEGERPGRQRRLLANAGSEVCVVPLHALRKATRYLLDLELERRIDLESSPRSSSDELDRPIVMRRAEPTRDETHVASHPVTKSGLEIVRIVADDRDP